MTLFALRAPPLRLLLPLPGGGAGVSSSRSSIHSSATARASVPKLTLFTGTHCQLCDVAKAVLDEIGQTTKFDLELYNIRDDTLPEVKRWRRAYQYDIPVLHLQGKGEYRGSCSSSSFLENGKGKEVQA